MPSVPDIDLSGYSIDPEVIKLVPARLAEKHKVLPLFLVGNSLTVAVADPRNIIAIDDLRSVTKMDITIVKSAARDIEDSIAEYYGISGIVEDVVKNYSPSDADLRPRSSLQDQSPVVKLVESIILQALRQRASDIHIEPGSESLRVRFRVDGFLKEELKMPVYMTAPIVTRIKVVAGMDIAESRIPQDGRLAMEFPGANVDIRISTFPSIHGEKVVMRLLDKNKMVFKLRQIGFTDENLEKFQQQIKKPNGMVLVTGPTGSGKSTTLYAALQEIDSSEANVTTVEDPIEYELPSITQSQVNVRAGLTFASALRAILRQDPDVILIGEIRDLETANIAIQAALTGHLVFSTLHTNDSVGALARMVDMGVERFLIAASVEAIIAQRLVRVICPKCKVEAEVPHDLKRLRPDIEKVYKGAGCKNCKMTGFKGRIAIFELLTIDDNTRKMIADHTNAVAIKNYAISNGMKTIFDDGLEKIKAGITTFEEILRVTKIEQL